jgi:hypothetical protein
MSKLVTPGDLHCFATCEHVSQAAADCPQSAPSTDCTAHWCVPEAWKPCARCRELLKAEVVAATANQ